MTIRKALFSPTKNRQIPAGWEFSDKKEGLAMHGDGTRNRTAGRSSAVTTAQGFNGGDFAVQTERSLMASAAGPAAEFHQSPWWVAG
jgi:hypothetical protein